MRDADGSDPGKSVFALSGFGAVAGFTVIYIMEGVPRMQRDVLSVRPFLSKPSPTDVANTVVRQKIPVFGSYWTGRELPASDNVRSPPPTLHKSLQI